MAGLKKPILLLEAHNEVTSSLPCPFAPCPFAHALALCSVVYSMPPPRGFIDRASPLPEEMLFINAFLDNELSLTLKR